MSSSLPFPAGYFRLNPQLNEREKSKQVLAIVFIEECNFVTVVNTKKTMKEVIPTWEHHLFDPSTTGVKL
jgi:hypothetical protein